MAQDDDRTAAHRQRLAEARRLLEAYEPDAEEQAREAIGAAVQNTAVAVKRMAKAAKALGMKDEAGDFSAALERLASRIPWAPLSEIEVEMTKARAEMDRLNRLLQSD